jgi:iron complex transport system substrate-binding protein
MRVVTLLPGATEVVAALGGGELVGVSHECDYPPWVTRLPRVTTTPIDQRLSGSAIDAEVRALRAAGRPVIVADAAELRRLAPDLIVTQGLCEVCAVADGAVHRLAAALDPAPMVLSLSARTLAGIWDDIRTVGRALDVPEEADELVAGLQARLARLGPGSTSRRRRVICVEWLEPLYLAGHWVPELVEAAGGADVGAASGSHSTQRTWDEVAGLRPELVVILLCGFGVRRARTELDQLRNPLARRALADTPVWVLDGNAFTSRPGPRVVGGAERLQAALAGREMPGLERYRWVE